MTRTGTFEFTCVNLTSLRKRLHLSQAELAAQVGVKPSHVSHWESGDRNPSLSYLCRLADALQCSIDDLVGRSYALPNALSLLPTATLLREALRRALAA